VGKKTIYVVAQGRNPGVYATWAQTQAQVDGYGGAAYKGFESVGAAKAWLREVSDYPPGVMATLETLDKKSESVTTERHQEALADGRVVIYTDGACTGNPGPGGYGCVILRADTRQELSDGFCLTTNNRMEILACIAGLEALTDSSLKAVVISDSKYVVDAITKGWAKKWRAKGWMRTETERPKNHDLWKRLLPLSEGRGVTFRWVKGHAGVEENERCDELAVAAAARGDLPPDPGYPEESPPRLF
jgi:ribonuclease HI